MKLETYRKKAVAALRYAVKLARLEEATTESDDGVWVPFRFVEKGISRECGDDPQTLIRWQRRLKNMGFTQSERPGNVFLTEVMLK